MQSPVSSVCVYCGSSMGARPVYREAAEALGELDERSRDILQRRWLSEHKSTLHELADVYGVSAERIRQLEKNAMKKIRTRMAEAA